MASFQLSVYKTLSISQIDNRKKNYIKKDLKIFFVVVYLRKLTFFLPVLFPLNCEVDMIDNWFSKLALQSCVIITTKNKF